MPSSSGTADLKGTPSIAGMSEWLQMLGYTVSHAFLETAYMT
jgi:hypothetical protein